MPTIFTLDMFRSLNLCKGGLERVAEFGGEIANTPEVWRAYVAQYPKAWRAPIWTASCLQDRGWPVDERLEWRVAGIAFRVASERFADLAEWVDLRVVKEGRRFIRGDDNWREATVAAEATSAAAAAAKNAYAVASCLDRGDVCHIAFYAASAAIDTRQVHQEITEMAITALVAADPTP